MTSGRKASPLFGIVLIIIGTLLFSISDASIKWLSSTYSSAQIGFIRSSLGICFVGMFVLLTNRLHDLKTSRLKWHLLRGVLGAIMILTSFYALANIPLLEVIAIIHAAPIFVAVLAPLLLKEVVSKHQWITIVVGFVGVLIILRPTPDHFHIAHLLMAIGALAYSCLILTARKLANVESIASLNFYIYPITIIASGILSIDTWVGPTPEDWLWFIVIAATATVALACYIIAVRHVEATTIAPLDYVSMIWATLLGYFIWQEIPDPVTFVGIVFIVFSGLYLLTHTRKITKAELSQGLEH